MIKIEPDKGRPHPNEIIFLGHDSSGREVRMNRRMIAAYNTVAQQVGFDPVITQGAFMELNPGGGADPSAGYHDRGGCIDTRIWNLTSEQQHEVIRVARSVGWAIWLRDEDHGGFEEAHQHWVLLGETDADSNAKLQMQDYLNGGDGMSMPVDPDHPDDYHPRPAVIPTFDYKRYLEDFDMQIEDRVPRAPETNTVGEALRAAIRLEKAFDRFRESERERDKALRQQIRDSNKSIREQLRELDAAVDALPDKAITKAELKQILAGFTDRIGKRLTTPENSDRIGFMSASSQDEDEDADEPAVVPT